MSAQYFILKLWFSTFLIQGIMSQLQTEFSLISKNENSYFRLGNIGKVPYGHKIQGRAFYLAENSTYDACDIHEMKLYDFNSQLQEHEVPVVLVDFGNCSLSRKALNVQDIGAKVMLLVSSDSKFVDEWNYDDQIGSSINIPTIILNKPFGDQIKAILNDNVAYRPVFDFNIERFENIEVKYYFSSDNQIAVNFFKDFDYYYQKIKKHITFLPFYKSYNFSKLSLGKNEEDCIDDKSYYCASSQRGKYVIFENLRESCIHDLTDKYWEYMKLYDELCHNSTMNISKECSRSVMSRIGINSETIKDCVNSSIMSPTNSYLSRHAKQFQIEKVLKIPEIRINNVIYKGSWNAKYIFEAICSSIKNGDKLCFTAEGTSTWKILLILIGVTFLISLASFLALISYRKLVNKQIDEMLLQKIEMQSAASINIFRRSNRSKGSEVELL